MIEVWLVALPLAMCAMLLPVIGKAWTSDDNDDTIVSSFWYYALIAALLVVWFVSVVLIWTALK